MPLTLVPTTQPLPALHSDLADVPTVALSVAAITASWTASWMLAQQHTDAFTRLERRRDTLLPPPAPDRRTQVALLRPWRGWLRACAYKRVRNRKRAALLAFLLWMRREYLLLPVETSDRHLLSYQLWCAEATLAGQMTRVEAKRRVAVARAALSWRDAERLAWLSLEPAA